ncbi:polysialyltransferase family glycosyltransferase [Cellulophaga sp. L1A9]|uniref:polysialyltransferase family glycosyltransferase n=1 Tax=Cellulophaga sp. L1A9 TaxID=2686362 RepID=UPI00131E63B5|nr:polysialyltransferase family glycosyltransferase [Cellulophaga sp. L1A9]
MKHIFFLHSHITYFVSIAVINYKKINKQDILFVTARNYTNNTLKNLKTIDLSKEYDELNRIYINKFYSIYPYIKKFDKKLKFELKQESFTAYLPHVENKLMQLFATHKNCKAFNIIEEGGTSYAPHFMTFQFNNIWESVIKKTFNSILSVFNNRFYYVKVYDIRTFKKSEPTIFYSIDDRAFQGLPYTIKLIPSIEDISISYKIDNSYALVLEGAVEQGNLNFNTLLKGIIEIISKEKFEKIYIKYHPVQSTDNRKKIESTFKDHNIQFFIIPDEIPFEQIAISSKNLHVLGFSSSLLFYSKAFGCNVTTYENTLMEDKLFQTFRSKNNFDLNKLLN